MESVNPKFKIHLKKKDSDDVACNSKKGFASSLQITSRPLMVTCLQCKKIVEAEKRSQERMLN